VIRYSDEEYGKAALSTAPAPKGPSTRYGVCPCGVAQEEAGEIALDSPAAENPHCERRKHAWGKRRGCAERRLYYKGLGCCVCGVCLGG
jgi:hypothetical protein